MDKKTTDAETAEALRRSRALREKTYRERALRVLPHICANCGREFSGKRLRELTVHHKDHNHDNNPADGSNWELLCMYCHENEHARSDVAGSYVETAPDDSKKTVTTYRPFEALKKLQKKQE